jgi:hypothetical protein
MAIETRSSSAITAEDRRLLRQWIEQEENGGKLLSNHLAEFSEHRKELAPLLRFLRAKEIEERARRALADREHWHRTLSFRLISILFALGGLGVLVFSLWGEEQAFFAALYFFSGCATYYLAAQLLVTLRARRARKSWDQVKKIFQQELNDLRKKY